MRTRTLDPGVGPNMMVRFLLLLLLIILLQRGVKEARMVVVVVVPRREDLHDWLGVVEKPMVKGRTGVEVGGDCVA